MTSNGASGAPEDYAIFLMSPDGIITFWGEGARLIKWWTKDEAEGAHLRLLYPAGGSDDGTAEEHLVQAAERGEYSGEGQRIRSDGSTFWAGITLTALRDEHGDLLGFAKVTRDLTARRAADAMLEAAAVASDHARRDAVAASTAKSGFLASVSHEIRTPVNAVLGYLELREELAAAVSRCAVTYMPGPTPEAREEAADRALELFNEFIAVAERLSIASYRQAVATGDELVNDSRTADRTS